MDLDRILAGERSLFLRYVAKASGDRLNGMSGFGEVVAAVARWLNPVTGSPASPLETTVFLDSFGPSLMPRTSVHQGLATGLSVLAARGVTKAGRHPLSAVVPPDAGLAAHLAGRAVMGGVGVGLSALT